MLLTGVAWFALQFAPAEDYLAEASKALDAKQPAIAEPLLRKAIEAEPTDYGAHFNLALALSLQHKDPEAIAELRRTLELKPGLYEADLNLGILLVRNDQPADAATVLTEAATAKPKEPRPHLYLAQALLKLSKLPEAAAEFRAAGSKDGLLETAAAFEQAGRIEEATAIYREFPQDPAVSDHLARMQVDNRLKLADSYKADNKPDQMLEQLRLAAAGEPNNFDLRMAYGRALRDRRNLTAAALQFEIAVKLRPDEAPAWNELASALIVSGNYAGGLAALDRIHALGKEIPGDYFLRAITLDKLKQIRPALAAYRQFLDADSGAHPDQEFQARQRARIIESELNKR